MRHGAPATAGTASGPAQRPAGPVLLRGLQGQVPGQPQALPRARRGDPVVTELRQDPTTRNLVTSSLRLAGFTARAVPDGAQALAAIDRDRADLVILDVRLPGMDGFEVCRKLRADGNDIPVIFLTARDTPEDRLSGFTKGGDDYVTKPFRLESSSPGYARFCVAASRPTGAAAACPTPTSCSMRRRCGSAARASRSGCHRPSSSSCARRVQKPGRMR